MFFYYREHLDTDDAEGAGGVASAETVAFIPTDASTDFRPRNVYDWIQLDVQGLWFILYIHYTWKNCNKDCIIRLLRKCGKFFEFDK